MITIDKNPAVVIPNICEQDIRHKLIISVANARECQFVSYLLKDGNLIYERGCDIKCEHPLIGKWYDSFNTNNKTIIELMIKEWRFQHNELQYLIIENNTDFEQFIDKFNIKNNFRDELTAVWNQIQKNSGGPI
jgi:hypothetical protein